MVGPSLLMEIPLVEALPNLRVFAMRILAQKAQESAAERYFSLTNNVQSKNRGSIQPEFLEKRCLFCSEVLQEIVECANEIIHHGLQTVDEAQQPPPPASHTKN